MYLFNNNTGEFKEHGSFKVTIFVALQLWILFFVVNASAKTCTFNDYIRASENPFSNCPLGTDTIIIRDTFELNVNYEPLLFGFAFDGIMVVNGGVVLWSANVFLRLGANACILLTGGGHLYPNNANSPACNGLKTIYFDTTKRASCNGVNAPHDFAYVNSTGGISIMDTGCFPPMANKLSPQDWQIKLLINPAKDQLNIQTAVKIDEVFVYDPFGHQLMNREFGYVNENFSLDIQHLPQGLFLVSIKSGKLWWNGSFVKY